MVCIGLLVITMWAPDSGQFDAYKEHNHSLKIFNPFSIYRKFILYTVCGIIQSCTVSEHLSDHIFWLFHKKKWTSYDMV